MLRNLKHLCRKFQYRNFGSHSHGPPGKPTYVNDHLPEFHARLGQGFLVLCFFWIMYQMKEDKGKFLGLYQPWLDEHAHHEHINYVESESGDTIPSIEEHHDEDEDEEHGNNKFSFH